MWPPPLLLASSLVQRIRAWHRPGARVPELAGFQVTKCSLLSGAVPILHLAKRDALWNSAILPHNGESLKGTKHSAILKHESKYFRAGLKLSLEFTPITHCQMKQPSSHECAHSYIEEGPPGITQTGSEGQTTSRVITQQQIWGGDAVPRPTAAAAESQKSLWTVFLGAGDIVQKTDSQMSLSE